MAASEGEGSKKSPRGGLEGRVKIRGAFEIHAAGWAMLSSLDSRWSKALLIAAWRVGAVICAPKRSVT